MAYTTLSAVKLSLGIADCNNTYDAQLTAFISQADDLINEWLGRDLSLQNYVEYYKGNGTQLLVLNQRPVDMIVSSGVLNGTTTVSGLSSTAHMIVGMVVSGSAPTPVNNPTSPAIVPGTTIASITNGTTIVLSQASNVSSTQTLYFGCQVWVDEGAYWNQAVGAFPVQTALTPGADYAVDIDQTNGYQSRSGLIYSINQYWPIPFNYQPGLITPVLGPSNGNIKVQYTAGYAVVPAQLQLAANMLVARMRQVAQFGTAMQSESVKDYSYTLGSPSGNSIGLITPEIGSILARWVDIGV